MPKSGVETRTGAGVFARQFPDHVYAVHMQKADHRPPLLPAELALLHPRAAASRRLDLEVGRAAAHYALQALGEDSGPLLRGENGEPLWPAGVVGSITHAAGHVLAAVAHRDQCGGLGIDLERSDRWFPGLDVKVARGEELTWLQATARPRRRLATLELFSAKESIYKAFYPRVGRPFGFAGAQVSPSSGGGYEGRLTEGLDLEYPPDRSFRIDCARYADLVLTSVVLPSRTPDHTPGTRHPLLLPAVHAEPGADGPIPSGEEA